MKIQSADTNPIIEEKLINTLRESSVATRLSKVFKLNALAKQLSLRAISRKNPGLSDQELNMLFIKLNYGEKLHNKVTQYYSKSGYGKG
ncbi:MAG: hypothetical protein A2057_16745 [Ignavibacteria bacterium GWA2_35_9]|nr:MAG: hypothetical protein A2057_16745 [Ignavibacteria bacterium GWA2_35_9]OGU48800.1 MAG: hypothetical protein A2080_03440 [Ignavibacteria bacterium GWC2_36_12]